MRISSSAIYEAGTRQLNTLQSQLARTQQQLGSNKRLLSAADDPIASARALEVTQSQSINAQFMTNRQNARSELSQVDVTLSSAQSLIQDVQTIVVAAGNGAYSASDRETYATELEGKLDDLLAVANTADGAGGYVFSGFKSGLAPYTKSTTGAVYNGDQGQVMLQVGSSRRVQINATGPAVFDDIATGNGTFATGTASTNTGTGVVSPGVVTDSSLITGHDYALKFAVSGTPAVTTYTIQDLTANTAVPPPPAVAAPITFQSGAPISFDGVTFDVKGVPADGDTFTVKPSTKQSLFTTVTNLIETLRMTPATTPAGKAAYTSALTDASNNLAAGLDKVLGVRSSVGANLKELDYLDSTGTDADIQYAATLSNLQDLDMVEAISRFSQQQTSLEAAQKSFKMVSGLSLFNFI
jgi:flagellar hook-associated protein 3 FlgL